MKIKIYLNLLMSNRNFFAVYIFLLLYLSLIIAFYFGEDALGGALSDYYGHFYISTKFNDNFIITFLNYNELGHRHSPVFYFFRSLLFFLDENIQKLFFLHLFLLIPFFFYKALKIKFKKINRLNLKIISLIIFLFPAFRAYSIWPDPHLFGTLFFMIAIYYFVKFEKSDNRKRINYACLNIFFVALSSYISPNFSVFSIFFFISFFLKYNFSKKTYLFLFLNLILAIPAFYYLFILDINFLSSSTGSWDIGGNFFSLQNLSNKFIIIPTILIFYLLPFLISKSINIDFKYFLKNKILILSIFFLFLFLTINFNFYKVYILTNSGGGFFYHLSQFFFKNNILLFIVSFISILIIFFISNKNYMNLILFICLIISNPQLTIWQANFSPAIYVFILLMFNFEFKNFFLEKKIIMYNYIYFISFLIISILKNNITNFINEIQIF